MLNLSNTPGERSDNHGLQLIRTPRNKPLTAIVTSEDMVCTETHWFNGRTRPHEDPDCEACLAGSPRRWHCYLSAMNKATAQHFLFECTQAAGEAFVTYRARYKTIRGCAFRASRPSGAIAGRVSIETYPADLARIHLPPPAHLELILSALWNLPRASMSKPYAENQTAVLVCDSSLTAFSPEAEFEAAKAKALAGLRANSSD